MKSFITFIFFILCLSLPLFSELQDEQKKIVYSVKAFDGMNFLNTFSVENQDVYFLAESDNFLWLQKSFIHFSPISKIYELDFLQKNENLSGNLEIYNNDNELIDVKSKMNYLIFNYPDEYKNNWQVFLGNDVISALEKIESDYSLYNESYKKYQLQVKEIIEEKKKLINLIRVYTANGKATNELYKKYSMLNIPEPIVEPSYKEISQGEAFYLNLSSGHYHAELRSDNGMILPDSDKEIIVFSSRRENNVGYQFYPGNYISPAKRLSSYSRIIYIDGSEELYFIPFYQNEYNDLFYNKMKDNQQIGNKKVFQWQDVKEIKDSQLEIITSARSQITYEQSFYVNNFNNSDSNLIKNKIVQFDANGIHLGREASFSGFHVPVEHNQVYIKLRLQDREGNYYYSSDREIRIIKKISFPFFLTVLALLPLLIAVVIIIKKKN